MAFCKYQELKTALDSKYPGVRTGRGENQYRRDPAYARPSVPNRVTLPQKHGSDIKGKTVCSICKQLGLKPEQFRRFVACPMSREEYIAATTK